MSDKTHDPTMEPRDYIFCGWREHQGHLYMKISTIVDDRIERTLFFKVKPRRKPVVGGIYHGAEFGGKSALGLEDAQFTRMWPDQGAIMEWTALSDKAETTVRVLKNESNARKNNEIENTLLPLRQQYATLQKRRDRAGLAALEEAVLRALRAPVRANEQTA